MIVYLMRGSVSLFVILYLNTSHPAFNFFYCPSRFDIINACPYLNQLIVYTLIKYSDAIKEFGSR